MKNKIIASLELVGVEMHNASGLVNRHKKCNIFVFAVAYLYTDRIYLNYKYIYNGTIFGSKSTRINSNGCNVTYV